MTRTVPMLMSGFAVALLCSALVACSTVGQSDVDEAFAEVGGVHDTHVSCAKGVCWVDVSLSGSATEADLAAAVAAAIDLDAETVNLETGQVRIEVGDAATDAGVGGPLAPLLVALRGRRDLESASVDVFDGVRAEVTTGDTDAWTVVEELWPSIEEVPGGTLRVTGASETAGLRSVTVVEELPRAGLTAARGLEQELGDGLSGIVLHPDGVWVGVLEPSLPAEVRRLVEEAAPTGELAPLRIYLTENVYEMAFSRHPVRDHTDVLTALAARPAVTRALQSRDAIQLWIAGDDLAGAQQVYAELVSDAGAGTGTGSGPGSPHVEVRPEQWSSTLDRRTGEPGEAVVELEPGSDPTLLDLAHRALSTGSRVKALGISTRRDRPHLSLRFQAGQLAPELKRTASMVARWARTYPELTGQLGVSVTAQDRVGRSWSISWEADLATDPPSILEVSGTAEGEAELRQAWEAGVRE